MKIHRDGFLVFIVKVMVATVIFYFALVLLPKKSVDSKININYLGNTGIVDRNILFDSGKIGESGVVFDSGIDLLQSAMNEIMNSGHNSSSLSQEFSYKTKFQRMCVENILVCIKIDYEGDFTYKDKFLYLASIVRVLDFIDKNSNTELKESRVLNKIAIKKDDDGRRGYATKNFVELNVSLVRSYKEFFDLVTHELGHVRDLGVVQGTEQRKSNIFTEFGKSVFSVDDPSFVFYRLSWNNENIKRSDIGREDFVSRYGASDPFEDEAEAFVLYVNHNAVFKYLAETNIVLRQKYNYFANFFDGKYLFSSVFDISLFKDNKNYRVWDITRMGK